MSGVRIGILAACGALVPVSASLAQEETIAEIVVTAQKREQSLLEVPIAVTALSGDALQSLQVTDVRDLNQLAPGLQVKSDDNAANPKIFIRGIGLNDFNPNTASAVGIYTDGVYIASPLAQMGQFFDVERIEVLRGPQGTLYGRNTTGGAINVITNKPTHSFDASANLELGSFDSVTAGAAVGGPLVDGVLAARLAAVAIKDDGFMYNRVTGNFGNNTDRWSGRASFALTPSDNFDAQLQLRYSKADGGSIQAYNRSLFPAIPEAAGPDGLCAPTAYSSGACTNALGYANTSSNLHQGDYDLEGRDTVETYGASATLTWNIGALSLISVTGYDDAERDDLEDTDASPDNMLVAHYRAQQKTFSEELRLQSADPSSPAEWVLGVYYANDDLESDSTLDVLRILRPLFITPENPTGVSIEDTVVLLGWPFTQKTESIAAFGQVDYDLTDRLTGTVGLRWSKDTKDFNYTSTAEEFITLFSVNQEKDFDSVSGRLGLQYRISDSASVYASYNRGYKSGGFFGGQSTDPADLAPYQDEVVDAYEVGMKSEWLDRRLLTSFSAFYYDYQDLQVYTLVLRDALTVQNFTNASDASIYGAELEITARPTDALSLGFSASLLDATYKDFVTAGNEDYSDNRLPNAPRTSLSALARYEWNLFGGQLALQADATWRSKVYFDTRNLERISDPERAFVNARLGWTTPEGTLELGVWGRNLTNEDSIGDILPIEGFGYDAIAVGPPRTAGLYARYRY